MPAIYIPAAPGCAEERAKSKPVFLGGGWKSGVAGGAGDFSEDFIIIIVIIIVYSLWVHG